MEAPDNIYVAESLIKTPYGNEWSPTPYISRENTEYIRKDIVDEMLKTAEDHAYFAGSESMREKVISLIESRITEIMGDAQPAPVLRIELRELIKQIKEEENDRR